MRRENWKCSRWQLEYPGGISRILQWYGTQKFIWMLWSTISHTICHYKMIILLKVPLSDYECKFQFACMHCTEKWDKVVKNLWKFQLLEKKVRTIFFCVSAKNGAPCKKIMDLSPASGTDSISIERITLQMEWISTPNRLDITPFT